MIITKKKFEEEIAKVRAEEQTKFEKWQDERNEKRWLDERLCNMDRRMRDAFGDIDRRLTELEKHQSARPEIAVCQKY